MVVLLQTAFREGLLSEEAMCQAVVLIPKGGKGYCDIVPVEVMWKLVVSILNRRLKASVAYHDSLQRFGRFVAQVPPTSRPSCFGS